MIHGTRGIERFVPFFHYMGRAGAGARHAGRGLYPDRRPQPDGLPDEAAGRLLQSRVPRKLISAIEVIRR